MSGFSVLDSSTFAEATADKRYSIPPPADKSAGGMAG
jgi:hypothetical protein